MFTMQTLFFEPLVKEFHFWKLFNLQLDRTYYDKTIIYILLSLITFSYFNVETLKNRREKKFTAQTV